MPRRPNRSAPADGQLAIGETIRYDFGAGQRHGVFRKIPVR
jgi:hypothetical protein